MKKKRASLLIAGAVGLVVVAAAVGGLLYYLLSYQYERNISTIESSTQQVGGLTVTIYSPILSNGVDWDALSDSGREGTARNAVRTAIKMANERNVSYFSVLCLSNSNSETLFYFASGSDTITLYSGSVYIQIPL